MVGAGVVLILGLAALGSIKQPASSNTQATVAGEQTGDLQAAEQGFDFGTISMKDGNVSHAFAVTNNSSEPITITKVYTSCMCTTASITADGTTAGPFGMPGHGAVPKINHVVAPGAQATIDVTFDPNAHGPAGVGKISRAVTLETAAGDKVELTFAAVVTP